MSSKWTYEIGYGYESILRDGVMVNKEQAVRALNNYESRIAELEYQLEDWTNNGWAEDYKARIAELEDVLEKVYDEWITCDDDWWTEEVDELKEKAAHILKNLPEVQE